MNQRYHNPRLHIYDFITEKEGNLTHPMCAIRMWEYVNFSFVYVRMVIDLVEA